VTGVHKPMLLVILDGWGHSEDEECNAIHAARTPCWDALWRECPHTLISASGGDVGLPGGQMGNSEVGHMHIGAGRLVAQELTRISEAIEDGSFFENPVCRDAFERVAGTGGAVHLAGLLSPGGVHSHETHFHAMLELALASGVGEIYVHAFLDGRDTPPKSASDSLARLADKCAAAGQARIASLCGRYFAMDRNRNWERTERAWRLLVAGEAAHRAPDALAGLNAAYERGETDEFVAPTAVLDEHGRPAAVREGDCVVFMNFRADRARQLSRAFLEPELEGFDRGPVPRLGAFVTLTEYSADFDAAVAFPPQHLEDTLGEHIASLGLKQLRIAETEKYAHVTFFLNGGEERVFEGEDRLLVPSPEVATYDQQPEMSAREVTDRLIECIEGRSYDAIVCNFANPDMVGHTGDFEATRRAIETVDECLGRLVEATRRAGMEMLITADHGNAEQMCGDAGGAGAGQAHTAHTANPVPLIYVGRAGEPRAGGCLSDVAPTMLACMGLPPPAAMTGRPLFRLAEAHGGRLGREHPLATER